jgi:hypothetical protein
VFQIIGAFGIFIHIKSDNNIEQGSPTTTVGIERKARETVVQVLSAQSFEFKMSSSGIAVGLNRGFPVTKRVVGARPSNAKAVSILVIVEPKQLYFSSNFFCMF